MLPAVHPCGPKGTSITESQGNYFQQRLVRIWPVITSVSGPVARKREEGEKAGGGALCWYTWKTKYSCHVVAT